MGASTYRGYQTSRRGGTVHADVRVDGTRATLGGDGVIVADGERVTG